MDMRTVMMLALEMHPVVCNTQHPYIESIDKLQDSVIEEPISNSWILDDSLGTGRPGIRIFRADETS